MSLVKTVLKHINFKRILLFSDSRCALGALRSFSAKLKLVFAERVMECQKTIEEHNITVLFIEGKLNPADEGTKIDNTEDDTEVEKFPDFLEGEEETWPVIDYSYDSTDIKPLMNPKLMGSQDTFDSEVNVNRVINDEFLNNLLETKTFHQVVLILQCYFQWTQAPIHLHLKFLLSST